MAKEAASRTGTIPPSLITVANEWVRAYRAVNLASGFPEFPVEESIKEKVRELVTGDINQYSLVAGALSLRDALAEKLSAFNGIKADAGKEITITCGTAEALFIALFSLVNPGDEVIIFEPSFESYVPDVIMAGGVPRLVRLTPPSWDMDRARLKSLFNNRTKAVIVNTPHNPTGKVFTRDELLFIGELCARWGAFVITDEIYEYITYEGNRHVSMASLPGMGELTVTTGGLGKTFNCTGWRLGYAVAPESITASMRKVHTYVTVCAPSPLQEAGAHALKLPESYIENLRLLYHRHRDLLCTVLAGAGFIPFKPQGAYYVMADFTPLGFHDDMECAHYLAKEIGVGAVPERAFCAEGSPSGTTLRFCFCKKEETLMKAGERLKKLAEGRRGGI
ncbi:MAG: aminotransferase class I/II-fold pyridoxal phosphate-dependent enzyme [Candidatus Eremiobacteraeota bacterium]|nr:aminotransferase class I/II-fold pyridoxal phosphate-dependent enzyme [Candidatus Eremiobacteraeota bacterium]